MKKELQAMGFISYKHLTDFVKEKNIQREDILAITTNEETYQILYYYINEPLMNSINRISS
jgi:hypothetical protein